MSRGQAVGIALSKQQRNRRRHGDDRRVAFKLFVLNLRGIRPTHGHSSRREFGPRRRRRLGLGRAPHGGRGAGGRLVGGRPGRR